MAFVSRGPFDIYFTLGDLKSLKRLCRRSAMYLVIIMVSKIIIEATRLLFISIFFINSFDFYFFWFSELW